MPTRRSLALVAAPLVTALCLAPSFTAGATTSYSLKFGRNVDVYDGNIGEPGLAIHGKDVYVTTPGSGGTVWGVSHNGGASFAKGATVKPPSPGRGVLAGSDSDVAVGADGAVFVGDLTIDGIEVSR